MKINDSSLARGNDHSSRSNENSGSTRLKSLSATLPGYDITREIRGGAQGVVYEAIQESTGRKVAIKVMKEGPFAGSADHARFEREVRVLGRIQHPNIVGIHATGIAAGCRFFVMDFIDGLALGGYMAAGRRSIDESLRLFAKICEAVSAAHLCGIVHRDLKPTNIVVDPDDQPHVLDFGLAKFSRSRIDVDISVTQSGDFVGTPAYAAPEQVRLEHDSVDGRTDIYSLGMILFQMLTGGMPYPISSDIRKLADAIEHTPPQRPSRLNPLIGRELDFIVLKALAKENENRYQSATAFAADIRRYLAGQSVLAHPPSPLYQFRKLVARHRVLFAFAATVLILLTTIGVVSTVLALRLSQKNQLAMRGWREADRQREQADRMKREAVQQAAEARARSRRADWQAYVANLAAAAATRPGDLPGVEAARRRLDAIVSSLINWEWSFLMRRMDRIVDPEAPNDLTRLELRDPVRCIAFSPDGRHLAAGMQNGGVSIHAVAGRAPPLALPADRGPVNALDFTPDGQTMAVACDDGAAHFWSVSDGELLGATAPHSAAATAVRWNSTGRRVAVGYEDGRIAVWNPEAKQPALTLHGHTARVSGLYWSATGDFLVSAAHDASLRVWNPSAARQIGLVPFRDRAALALAVSPDEKLLVCGLSDGDIVIAQRTSLENTARLVGHMEPVTGLTFSPDGTRLVSVSADGTMRLWDVAKQEEILMLHEHEAPIASVSFSPDGARIATASIDGGLRVLQAKRSADEHVRQMADGLTPAEVIEFLEADDALEAPFRRVALEIAGKLKAPVTSQPVGGSER